MNNQSIRLRIGDETFQCGQVICDEVGPASCRDSRGKLYARCDGTHQPDAEHGTVVLPGHWHDDELLDYDMVG